MRWLRHSSFCGVTAVHGHPERGLYFMSLSRPLKRTTHCLAVLTSTIGSPETFSKCWWMSVDAIFFPRWAIQRHTFASYSLPCQMPFHQTAPLLPSVTRQQHVTECWWQGLATTAIPPAFTPDVAGQHTQIYYFWSSPCIWGGTEAVWAELGTRLCQPNQQMKAPRC